jgi:hypothetical protein
MRHPMHETPPGDPHIWLTTSISIPLLCQQQYHVDELLKASRSSRVANRPYQRPHHRSSCFSLQWYALMRAACCPAVALTSIICPCIFKLCSTATSYLSQHWPLSHVSTIVSISQIAMSDRMHFIPTVISFNINLCQTWGPLRAFVTSTTVPLTHSRHRRPCHLAVAYTDIQIC